jgi:hypothetical protein
VCWSTREQASRGRQRLAPCSLGLTRVVCKHKGFLQGFCRKCLVQDEAAVLVVPCAAARSSMACASVLMRPLRLWAQPQQCPQTSVPFKAVVCTFVAFSPAVPSATAYKPKAKEGQRAACRCHSQSNSNSQYLRSLSTVRVSGPRGSSKPARCSEVRLAQCHHQRQQTAA